MARKREKADEEPAGKRRQVEPGPAPGTPFRPEPCEDEEPGKRRRVEPAPGTPSFGPELGDKAGLTDLLVEKVMKQLDLDLLLEKVSPELSKRVFAAICVDDLGEKVIELLAAKLLESSGLLETLSTQLLEKF